MSVYLQILNSFVSVLFPWIIFRIIKLVRSMICVMLIDFGAVFLSLNFIMPEISAVSFKNSVHMKDKWCICITLVILLSQMREIIVSCRSIV